MQELLIKNGHLFDPSTGLDTHGSILVEKGKIAGVITGSDAGGATAANEIDAAGSMVVPGFIDLHTHLREPGEEHKETIESGTRSAAAGGFTTVCCMPNTSPVNDNSFVTSHIMNKVRETACVNVFPVGAMSKDLEGKSMASIGSMVDAGIVAVSDDGRCLMNTYLLRKVMDYCRFFDIPVVEHCEDESLVGKGLVNEGFISSKYGIRGIPSVAEDIIVARDVALAEHTGVRLHIAHISTARSVETVRRAKERGVRVSCEVTPHHLVLSDEWVSTYDTRYKVRPPLRSAADMELLRKALADEVIDAVATDHAPHSVEEKQVEFEAAAFGIVGLETALSLLLKLSNDGVLTLERVISSITSKPAEIFGFTEKGSLKKGYDADITIFNPKVSGEVDVDAFESKSRNSPFKGWELPGKIEYTIAGGRVAYPFKEG